MSSRRNRDDPADGNMRVNQQVQSRVVPDRRRLPDNEGDDHNDRDDRHRSSVIL